MFLSNFIPFSLHLFQFFYKKVGETKKSADFFAVWALVSILSSHESIYELQKKELSNEEVNILETISLFENDIPMELITGILELPTNNIIRGIISLRNKNILQPTNANRNPSYINAGFKKYIYSKIDNIESKHRKAGNVILEYFPKMEIFVTVNQFEQATDFEKAKEIIDVNLNRLIYLNYPQIRIKFLSKLLSYNISNDERVESIIKLCDLYTEIGKYSEALKLISELSKLKLNKFYVLQKDRLHGTLLIKTGELSEGIKKLIVVVDKLPKFKSSIYLELASAYIELNKYDNANSICHELLKQPNMDTEAIGRAQNLLGISNMYDKADLNITLNYFEEAHKTYTSINNFNRIAGSEVNIGNIQNILGNYSRAEKHWNKARYQSRQRRLKWGPSAVAQVAKRQ